MKTEKRKMTLAKFLEYAKSEVKKLEANPDPERSALLSAAMEKSTEAKSDEEFEVEVIVEEAPTIDLTEVNAKLDEIKEKVSKLEAGTVEKATHDVMIVKQGLAVELAVELLTAYQQKINDLSEKLQSGGDDIDRDKLWDTFSSWSVEDAVANALTTLGKSENAPDEAVASEVGEALKAAFAAKTAATPAPAPVADDDPAPAIEKVDTCKQCGADMAGADVCPECGWKVGTEVKTEKRRLTSNTIGDFPSRYTGKTQED